MNISKAVSKLFLLTLVIIAFKSPQVAAQTVPLQNLDADQLRSIVGDMSSAFLHTSVSGAGTLGRLWGFEVGVIGANTSTPHLQSVANQASSGNVDAAHIPDAALLGRLGLPLGLSAEATFLPSVGASNFKATAYSLAAKWTATDIFGDLPLDLALKVSYTHDKIDFSGTVNSNPISYEYTSGMTTAEIFVSKNFYIFEPYAAFGWVKAQGGLSYSGSALVFDQTYTQASSASESRSDSVLRVGTEIKFSFARLGVEYANAFASSRFTGKLSAAF